MFKKDTKKIVAIALWIAGILLMGYTFASARINLCDYSSYNGDFQSYNAFRRILDGQIPYVDFSNYIGMAPIVVNVPFLLFNNTFAQSLFITNFTSCILFSIAVFLLMKLITKNTYVSLLISLFLPQFVSNQGIVALIGETYGHFFTHRFTALFTPSHSMRSARSFLPFLLVILMILTIEIYKKYSQKDITLIKTLNNPVGIIIIGFVQGFFIVWSNDFGFASFASTLVVIVFLQIFLYENNIFDFTKNIISYIGFGIIGLFISTSIITLGNPNAWLSSVIDTADYQHFYFGSGGSIMPHIFASKELLRYTTIFIVILCTYLYKLIKKDIKDEIIYLTFIALAVLAGTYIYILGGSGYNLREPIEVYSILFLFGYFIKFILHILNKYVIKLDIVLVGLLVIVSGYISYQAITFTPNIIGEYSEELGGTTTYHKAIFEASEYVGDEEIFSLYSTGLEVVLDKYQPTGYDYIIHVLGEDTQKGYVEEFVKGDFEYVQTPSIRIGAWLANRNWYFYRELLLNYSKDFQTEYSWIWKRDEVEKIDAQVSYEMIIHNESIVEIVCTSDYKEDFIVEFLVDYELEFDSIATMIRNAGKKHLYTSSDVVFDEDGYVGSVYPENSIQYVPLAMKNGEGRVTLYGANGEGILLNVNSIQYTGNYPPIYLGEDK